MSCPCRAGSGSSVGLAGRGPGRRSCRGPVLLDRAPDRDSCTRPVRLVIGPPSVNERWGVARSGWVEWGGAGRTGYDGRLVPPYNIVVMSQWRRITERSYYRSVWSKSSASSAAAYVTLGASVAVYLAGSFAWLSGVHVTVPLLNPSERRYAVIL